MMLNNIFVGTDFGS